MQQGFKSTQPPKPIQEAIDWLLRLRDENLSEADSHAFADWLTQDVSHAEAFAQAETLFDDMVAAAQLPHSFLVDKPNAQLIQSDPAKITASRRKYRPWLVLPLSLAAAWLFAVLLILPSQSQPFDRYFSDYHTGTGETRDIQLADGSQLLLNTDTAVSVDYQTTKRQFILHHGQVRFSVAQDAQRPFEVQADKLKVRALGTVFEVYKHSDKISVTVQEHAVAAWIEEKNQAQPATVLINTGQQLIYQDERVLQPPSMIDLVQTSAWQQRRLSINDRPLSEFIAELERYRTGRIFLTDPQLKTLRVTGVFSLDNPDAVLTRVSKVLGLQETRLGTWWVLLHR